MALTSVQLYSVRDAFDADMAKTVARVAEIGYQNVEPYAFSRHPGELAKALADNGLKAPSGHDSLIAVDDPQRVFEAAQQAGIGIVIDPFVPVEHWRAVDDVKKTAQRINELADQAKQYGVKFGYHNHQWEFASHIDGRPAYEYFIEELGPDAVLEVDTFWATVGGADAPDVLRRLGDRVAAIHVKDGLVSGDIADVLPSSESALVVPKALADAFKNQKPAGQGDVDVKAILEAAPQAIRVVEFDDYAGDVFDGITESLAWLKENDK